MDQRQDSLSNETIKEICDAYERKMSVPDAFPTAPFLVGIIGNIGSGKTTFSQELQRGLRGSVIVSANSARLLLRERGLPWGENVRLLVWEMVLRFALRDVTVIVDGGMTERRARDQMFRIADARDIPLWFVRIVSDAEDDVSRTVARYDDPGWGGAFDDCRIGRSTSSMAENVRRRATTHAELEDGSIEGLAALVVNTSSRDHLIHSARRIAERLVRMRERWKLKFEP